MDFIPVFDTPTLSLAVAILLPLQALTLLTFYVLANQYQGSGVQWVKSPETKPFDADSDPGAFSVGLRV